MPQPPHWYGADFPEFRSGPPWVMEDMIASETRLPQAIASNTAATAALVEMVLTAAQRGDPVVTTGCGTAAHAAQAVAALLNEALDRRGNPVRFRYPLEAAFEAEDGLCLAVSHGGRSRATIGALGAARARGAVTALITAYADAPAAMVADEIVLIPIVERSWCHTVAYLAPIIAAGMIATGVRAEELRAIPLKKLLERSLGDSAACEDVAHELDAVERIVVVGSDIDLIAARELALKLNEAVWLPAVAHDLEDVVHGHLVAQDERSALIAIATSRDTPRYWPRLPALLRFARRIGMNTAGLISSAVEGELDPALLSAGWIRIHDEPLLSPRLASLSASAITLQRLVVALAHRRGRNPDLLRREDSAHREGRLLAEAKYFRSSAD
jgi:glutamine---fructose-6-phosphate transaminase (isomerizing)